MFTSTCVQKCVHTHTQQLPSCAPCRTTYMPLLQKHPDSFCRGVRPLPKLQLVSDAAQQVQSCVPVLPVLQLQALVLSRHSDAGEPGEDGTIRTSSSGDPLGPPPAALHPLTFSSTHPVCQWGAACFHGGPGSGRPGRSSGAEASPPDRPSGTARQ